ncbi:uncharacterized protein LOC116182563 [Photinus pyralis]|uniref:uncharacterized protein LOC116164045 n=1 Tax=Photinus pyralis TaxID=7054 RepID=UPI0012673CEB|nr:uncharacterized protein LOC116164045 [Photinus pyralis]XP_031358955.1 uncharacterized protein LOC116182563 [Photinus pyralis]
MRNEQINPVISYKSLLVITTMLSNECSKSTVATDDEIWHLPTQPMATTDDSEYFDYALEALIFVEYQELNDKPLNIINAPTLPTEWPKLPEGAIDVLIWIEEELI